ncbi:zinc finger domain-containing protein [Actinotalea sp. K2]|uniref:Fpg/Nei family DNA glycosylase n=1 Tax=Actinotalea sp. K2 TaxID=2939438 RepID=UPI0020172BE6|nr:zinc finger domain-containing protein [Actinotalea sp. K2]MCL3859697.1 Fpg/Nei family DNA glycosylase [Actinotalea sp. K2]
MPEGHTVHRIALQLSADMVGERVSVSSPQGRFAAGAALLDGALMTRASAVGKQLFVDFERETHQVLTLRVHLGLYGAWDFAGQVSPLTPGGAAISSMGAPRVQRAVRMGEGERVLPDGATGPEFPPPPVGQVRVRLLTAASVADLRGPTACEVLTPQEVATVVGRAGPDPRVDHGPQAREEFVRRLTTRRTAVGQLLMDQGVVSGIGNIYRAEMLFRARLSPRTPGTAVPPEIARRLWEDWVVLLEDGVRTGVMITRTDLDEEGRREALGDRAVRHAVYGRGGQPCLVCGTPVAVADLAGRTLYWCPTCQA